MQPIFHVDALNTKLRQDGYVIVDFLDNEEVTNLRHAFQVLHPSEQSGFYASSHVEDRNFRRQVNDSITAVFQRPMMQNLINVEGLGGAFISKAPGKKGILPLHQDWNIVDETKWRSYNIWVPLVDVSEHNGAVMVLKGSHSKKHVFRGPNIPPILPGDAETVLEHMELLPMRKGQALIYDHALWHASPINQSDDPRLVAVYGMAPKSAPIKFYHMAEDMIYEYNASADFYLYENPGKGPSNLKLNQQYHSKQRPLSIGEFYEIYGDASWKINQESFLTRSVNKLKWIFGQ